jgi:hypothetical protein
MRDLDLRTDGELLVATALDPEAFAVFYRRHSRGMQAFFRRRTGDMLVAQQLTTKTFAAALEESRHYVLRPEPARSWLYGIAWSELHDAGYAVYTRDPSLSGRFQRSARRVRSALPARSA